MKQYPPKLKTFLTFFVPVAVAGLFTACQMSDPSVMPPQPSPQKPVVTPTKQVASVELLSRYHWRLVSAKAGKSQMSQFSGAIEAKKSSMNFAKNNSISYSLGCNQSFGVINLQAGVLNYGALASTRKACPDFNNAEMALASWMKGSHLTIELSADKSTATLTQTKGNEVLTWHGLITHEARFGQPVQLFWEIAPEVVHCVDGGSQETHCLKVRNVNYDEQGIKVGSGAWRVFHGEIQGFEHDANLRQIIRLNAYQDSNDPDKLLYIFDRAVETELIQNP